MPQAADSSASLQSIEAAATSGLPALTSSAGENTIVLINGQNQPVISLVAEQWYRLRIVFASVLHYLNLFVDGCELTVLTKDGIYLLDGPRPTDYLFFVSRNRVDALIKCPSEGGASNNVKLESKAGVGI